MLTRVWLVRLLLLALDLTALGAKIVYCLTNKNGPYWRNLEGQRASEGLGGDQQVEDARTEQQRIKDFGRAKRRQNRARADQEELFGEWTDFGANPTDAGIEDAQPIEGFGLDRMADEAEDWERRPVTVPPDLRRGGFIGLGLTLGVFTMSWLLGLRGLVLFAAAAALALLIFARSRGFRRARGWVLQSIFATLIAGLAAPVFLLALNL